MVTLLERRLAAAIMPPLGLNATELGSEPSVENGEPETAVSTPPVVTENTDMLLLL